MDVWGGAYKRFMMVSGPETEPVSLAELKLHLRLDSGSFAENIDSTQSIAPGSHATTSGYGLTGTAVEILGYQTVVYLKAGENGTGGTVDVKVQESDDNSAWVDWTSGAFTQVTTANDHATYEKAYTGSKRYIRTVARILVAACDFGVDIVRLAPTTAEDTLLNDLITTARERVEEITRRALITQTWDYCLPRWPAGDCIELPFGNLQTVESITYKDTDGTISTLPAGDYIIEPNGELIGRVVLAYGSSWPSDALYPANPITIRFTCGWASALEVPQRIKTAIKMICAELYAMRGEPVVGQTVTEDKSVPRLLASFRLWEEF